MFDPAIGKISMRATIEWFKKEKLHEYTLMLHTHAEENAQECASWGCAQVWTGRGVLDRTSSPVPSTASDGVLSRERSDFYRFEYSNIRVPL
jgi:hypothetical protein